VYFCDERFHISLCAQHKKTYKSANKKMGKKAHKLDIDTTKKLGKLLNIKPRKASFFAVPIKVGTFCLRYLKIIVSFF
jgi:hypothetical protein